MLRVWGWVKRVPVLGWLIAVIAFLCSALWYYARRSAWNQQRRKVDNERHHAALEYMDGLEVARKYKEVTIASVNRERLLRDQELQQRRDAIDAAEQEGREALLARLDAAILRRRK